MPNASKTYNNLFWLNFIWGVITCVVSFKNISFSTQLLYWVKLEFYINYSIFLNTRRKNIVSIKVESRISWQSVVI